MKLKNIIWGGFFIAGAALIIGNQLRGFVNVNLIGIALTILLAAMILQSILHLNFFGILLPAALILTIFAVPLGLTALTPWPLLFAALFAAVGLSIIFKKHTFHFHHSDTRPCYNHRDPVETQETISEDDINSNVNFGAAVKYLHSENLKKARFSCHFGSLKVFFNGAHLSDQGAEVQVDVSFGAIELYVPSAWQVQDSANVTLGAVENHVRPGAGPVLTLTGNVTLGAVSVIYV